MLTSSPCSTNEPGSSARVTRTPRRNGSFNPEFSRWVGFRLTSCASCGSKFKGFHAERQVLLVSRDAPASFRSGSRSCGLLVLQLCFSLTAVVSGGGLGLVLSSPERPGHDKAGSDRRPEEETRQKGAGLGDGRQKRCQAPQGAAGTAGLPSLALPQVAQGKAAA